MTGRLKVLTWHVHGNYLYYLTQTPHDFYLVTCDGDRPGYAGKGGALPFGDNVFEVPREQVHQHQFDLILYQHKQHWDHDRVEILNARQQQLPRIYLEHDTPGESPFAERHWVNDPETELVHVTHFNQLMWDCGHTPTQVIEHGVMTPEGVTYEGSLERGIVVVNHLRLRGRRLGADVFERAREHVPLDLVGMDALSMGGLGEVANLQLAAFCAPYRFFFNPIRWTSLGLAVLEAMMIGMPIVGLATTELAAVIKNGENGYTATDIDSLVDIMQELIADQGLAARLGQGARETALERFSIERFAADWDQALQKTVAAVA